MSRANSAATPTTVPPGWRATARPFGARTTTAGAGNRSDRQRWDHGVMAEQVTDHPDQDRYEIDVDGVRGGFVQYQRGTHEIALIHTETDSRFRGHGLGGHLIAAVLDEARHQGLALVPADQRAEFGL